VLSNPRHASSWENAGGLKKKNKLGDLILPIAAIRGEGTSDDYFPERVPALPAFNLQKIVVDYHCRTQPITTGQEPFIPPTAGYGNMMKRLKTYLRKTRSMALIWKPQRFSALDLPITSPPELFCSFPINRWWLRVSRPRPAINWFPRNFTEEHLKIGIESLNPPDQPGIDGEAPEVRLILKLMAAPKNSVSFENILLDLKKQDLFAGLLSLW